MEKQNNLISVDNANTKINENFGVVVLFKNLLNAILKIMKNNYKTLPTINIYYSAIVVNICFINLKIGSYKILITHCKNNHL